jgi:polyhydroxybutyrate depolymerase
VKRIFFVLTLVCAFVSFSSSAFAQPGRFLEKLKERKQKREEAINKDAGPRESIMVAGTKREYLMHLPANFDKNKRYPLLLLFHGGGSKPEAMDKLTHFNKIADREGFIVVSPAGLNEHWNDGRGVHDVDDLGFISQLIDFLIENHSVDKNRVYAAGISNGGIFSQFLGVKLSDKIAAIASDVALLAENILKSSRPSQPISVMMIVSTEDPLMPFKGGVTGAGRWGIGGKVASAEDTLNYWVSVNGCPMGVASSVVELDAVNDGTKVIISRFGPCSRDSEVVFYKVEGGGHTWPGGPQYRSEMFIGKVCNEFNASEEIWKFLKNHT